MDRDELWRVVDDQREALTAQLEDLTDEEWRRPSLCAQWSVRDVVAHLTLQHVGVGEALAGVVRARGNVANAIRDAARAKAAAPTAALTAEIRGHIGSRRHVPFMTDHEALIDVVVHGQDIMLPLDRRLDVPPHAAAAAAARIWARPSLFAAMKPLRGYAFAATDTDFRVGDGPLVEGPAVAVLLLMTGRPVLLPRLTGPGAHALRGPSETAPGGATGG
ncbi:maleylpyruvate isomerase family mycothiol-dependent enzyme [Asanoa sp. WMMD1127]|uniref:maleylpyruvate isomerase family mycothiol-dependent enzyme n=1 Tax=Asanoa sp. WMMD1127 TaxID=3016107 RepID=UPI002416C7D7|nr:maleylpyruvate isomerase family mycothiol-dependent enzyme [Asanoa sp. WMMD1127]MDG4825538.1 maleylpyruvate isomerase family mycothiol-dependent enzyme [Asanoa sp. WMMD1127]